MYTNTLEMEKDQKCQNKKSSVYSFDDYSRMFLNQEKIDGIIINPYHKERSIVLNKDVIQYINQVKNKNMKTYVQTKNYLKDKKRRHKYEINHES
ncbi:MAG: SseB family protein [Faecalibacillus faecis]